MFKVGDSFKFTEAARDRFRCQADLADITHRLIAGDEAVVSVVTAETVRTSEGIFFYKKDLVLVNKDSVTPNYAAAFNMWMDDYMNNPEAYEDSHDSAVRHLKEKLNGEEPSYGAVCQEIFIKYLEKV